MDINQIVEDFDQIKQKMAERRLRMTDEEQSFAYSKNIKAMAQSTRTNKGVYNDWR